jgi:alpha-galactosidase
VRDGNIILHEQPHQILITAKGSFAMRTRHLLPAFLACLLVGMFLYSSRGAALENGVARTPPMGWNSWNKFGCEKINEQVVRATADQMASNGMKDAGYQYVVIDDCWQVGRDKSGNIVADPERFPSGIGALAEYVHSKGLKFGIYSDAGTKTCAKRPGSIGHEYQDAQQYANWGVDYLKEDWCNTLPEQSSLSSYTLMRDALAATGRPILFSICEWGSTKPWLWAGPVGNMWRSTGDIQDCWNCRKDWGGLGVLQIMDLMSGLETYAGPGHWNDPDMLEVGNGGMTKEEYRTHFSMWAMFAAPLLAGNDISNMSADTKEILLNKEVIAVDQDPMGIQGKRVKKMDDVEVWSKQLADGGRAVALVNRGSSTAKITATWQDIGYPASLSASVRDLWAAKDAGRHTASYAADVPSHGVVMVKVLP